MKQTDTELLHSTILLNQVLDSNLGVMEKLEVVLQIYKNLEILKVSIPQEDYDQKLMEIDKRVSKVINKINEPDFIEKVKSIFDKFLPNLESDLDTEE